MAHGQAAWRACCRLQLLRFYLNVKHGRAHPLAALTVVLFCAVPLVGQSEEAVRVDVGVRMFATLLGADVDLAKKADDGKLLLVIFYTNDKDRAEKLAAGMRLSPTGEPKKIGGLAVDVVITNDASLAGVAARRPAGIFLAQSPDGKTLRTVIQYGINNRVVVYSPFDGHVESGVLGGLSIGAQVKPYVNRATLEASQITLKELFMKVAKVHQ